MIKPVPAQSTASRFLVGVLIVIAAMLGGYSGMQVSQRELPIVMRVVEAVNPVVNAGGVLRVRYVLLRKRSCKTIIDRFIIDAAKTRHVLPDVNINAGLPLGDDDYTVPVDVPADAASGAATYRTVSNYVCSMFQEYDPIPGGTKDIAFVIRP